jgi:hypothetical protein
MSVSPTTGVSLYSGVSGAGGVSGGAGVTQVFRPWSVLFDGSNDSLARGADLTGNADSAIAWGAFWFKRIGGAGSAQTIMGSAPATPRYACSFDTANKLNFGFRDSGATLLLAFTTDTAFTVDGLWHSCLWQVDTSGAAGSKVARVVIDEAASAVTISTDSAVGGNVDWTTTNHFVGRNNAGATLLNAQIAEYIVAPGQTLDITSAPNVAKYARAGEARDIGPAGAGMTGAAPLIYLSAREGEAATAFGPNRGTGGTFVITGALELRPGPNG